MMRMQRGRAKPWLGVAALCIALALGPGTPVMAQSVPSGQPVTLQEAILEPQPEGGHWLRLRFIAPRLAGGGPDAALDDMEYLCRTVGLPVIAQSGQPVSRVVVSLASESVEFGSAAPGATQYFEVYTPSEDDCIWEEF